MEKKLDDLDKSIIAGLVENSRIQSKTLSRKLRIHPNTLLQRLKKLEEAGVIMKYTVVVDYSKIEQGFHALVFLNVNMHDGWEGECRPISRLPEVVSFSLIAGGFDAVIMARLRNDQHLAEFLRRLHTNRMVARTTTYLVIDNYKHSHDYNPLRDELDWRV
ncbi:Lrp/AsnC family transcriptional regulator [Candidatus Micrarchaeota archaeon]|nr:Lrp/AsnC family transcriptional regulator [Candidatus Micrarchaeota archaeon]